RHPKDESKREKSAVYKGRCENWPAKPVSARARLRLDLCIRAWIQRGIENSLPPQEMDQLTFHYGTNGIILAN
ncbi:hypothetical protein, partial [Duganella qianjiadongensis]|uniref:hypothetical protein n=1 Tax=Duganella qianjiadongensis TaxID=2692176 RepID=UPI001E4F6B77